MIMPGLNTEYLKLLTLFIWFITTLTRCLAQIFGLMAKPWRWVGLHLWTPPAMTDRSNCRIHWLPDEHLLGELVQIGMILFPSQWILTPFGILMMFLPLLALSQSVLQWIVDHQDFTQSPSNPLHTHCKSSATTWGWPQWLWPSLFCGWHEKMWPSVIPVSPDRWQIARG